MGNPPNYSTYHLDELEKALANIDESKKPEEAEIIRGYIEKGGYSYPTPPLIDKVKFISPTYKWSLTLILTYLLAYNAYALISWKTLIALVPITIQSILLYMIFKNHKHVRTLIKVWSVVLLVSAFFGFLSIYYATEVTAARVIDHLFSLVVGLSYLVFADKCVELVPHGSNRVAEGL